MMIHSSSMKFTGKLELPVLFWTANDFETIVRSSRKCAEVPGTTAPEEIHISRSIHDQLYKSSLPLQDEGRKRRHEVESSLQRRAGAERTGKKLTTAVKREKVSRRNLQSHNKRSPSNRRDVCTIVS